ncbi:hypothetical protein LCGC14_1596240 [marine sediment metagenome]|uniref:Uncharacterized protein n=1 Tax=marine sediment metagenome TaxID=412755 RepID=A0A0F9KT49_9ZZZZ|nr:hypothetical protein [Candidatus Scalindua sediminis]
MGKYYHTKKTTKQSKRITKAKRNLSKIEKEIEPFIKKKKIKRPSPSGEWTKTSSLLY